MISRRKVKIAKVLAGILSASVFVSSTPGSVWAMTSAGKGDAGDLGSEMMRVWQVPEEILLTEESVSRDAGSVGEIIFTEEELPLARAGSLPGPAVAATRENVLAVVEAYDADVYYILQNQLAKSNDFMEWYGSNSTLISELDTAVHETYHSYTFTNSPGALTEAILTSATTSYDVNFSDLYRRGGLFKTEEWSKDLDPSLRTFRYSTYVAQGVTPSANEHGIYGLLNEFSAYGWGLHMMCSLVPYLLEYDTDGTGWKEYVSSLANNMTAYNEFKYWILKYMLFAKEHHPDSYTEILSNTAFCNAYADTEIRFKNRFLDAIDQFDDLNKVLVPKGIRLDKANGEALWCFIGSRGSGLRLKDFNLLNAELDKAELVEMDSIIKQHADISLDDIGGQGGNTGNTGNIGNTGNTGNPGNTGNTGSGTGTGNTGSGGNAGTVVPSDPISEEIQGFVKRLYSNVLGRTADAQGIEYWGRQLADKEITGAQAAQGFFGSNEFVNRNVTDAQYLEICYKTMMNRTPDQGGIDYWQGLLDSGLSRMYILGGFASSREFKGICDTYGIETGEVILTEYRDKNEGVTAFISRCYTKALGRKYDASGLNFWCKEILTAEDASAAAVNAASDGFFHSNEFRNKNTDNAAYIAILYRTFLGRELDQGGYEYWMAYIAEGNSRDDVLNGFAESNEFKNICANYGL